MNTTIKNRLTQGEWDEIGQVVSLMDDPVFDDYVKFRLETLLERHGAPLLLLNVSEVWTRLFGIPNGYEMRRMEFVTGYKNPKGGA